MSIFVALWQALVGPEKGPCVRCGKDGWKQMSIVDPCSPSLKIYCREHHEENSRITKIKCEEQTCNEVITVCGRINGPIRCYLHRVQIK